MEVKVVSAINLTGRITIHLSVFGLNFVTQVPQGEYGLKEELAKASVKFCNLKSMLWLGLVLSFSINITG